MANSDNGSVERQVGSARAEDPHAKQYQEFWFSLARLNWSSLVLVPVDPGGSAEQVAQGLADVGKRLSDGAVTALTVRSLEYGTAMALAGLPQFVDRKRLAPSSRWPVVDLPPGSAEEVKEAAADGAAPVDAPASDALVLSSTARIIISIPPIVSEPLGLATTQEADLIVLCIELGRTRMADARRAIQLIGRERVAGCLLLP
jgi:hypothetical protein